jgi:hypothetical protein
VFISSFKAKALRFFETSGIRKPAAQGNESVDPQRDDVETTNIGVMIDMCLF